MAEHGRQLAQAETEHLRAQLATSGEHIAVLQKALEALIPAPERASAREVVGAGAGGSAGASRNNRWLAASGVGGEGVEYAIEAVDFTYKLVETAMGMDEVNVFAKVTKLDVGGKFGETSRSILQMEAPGHVRQLPHGPQRRHLLAVSTGCPSGEVADRLGQFDEAVKAASDYKDIFGEGRYFLELMDHGIERRVRDGLLEIGRKLNIPPLVTNDSHYTYAHEATAHDAMLCIQTGKNLSDPDKYEVDVITKLGPRCTSSSSPTSSCGPRTTASR